MVAVFRTGGVKVGADVCHLDNRIFRPETSLAGSRAVGYSMELDLE